MDEEDEEGELKEARFRLAGSTLWLAGFDAASMAADWLERA